MSLMSQSSGGGGNMTNTIKNILLLSSDKTKILLEFNHNLDYGTSYGGSSSNIEMADFAVTVGGSSVTPASGNFSGTNSSADKWLSLTLPSAISVYDDSDDISKKTKTLNASPVVTIPSKPAKQSR